MDKIAVIVPTLNASGHLKQLLPALAMQGVLPSQILVIDSSSDDDTVALAQRFGARIHIIARVDFNHGGTRRLAAELCDEADILVLLTQDAVPVHPEAIARIAAVFDDASIGMAYGRQLPRAKADAIEAYARLRNYPATSAVRQLSDRVQLGIKTVFCSNSFSAYRKKSLLTVGSFPRDSYFGEDQIVAGRMLLAGVKLAYVADAEVVHSHGYTIIEDFKRNFDVGIFHATNSWLLESFGYAEGEGWKFVRGEIAYLWRTAPRMIPSAIVRTMVKFAGYRLGRAEAYLSRGWKMRLSMQPFYWRIQSD